MKNNLFLLCFTLVVALFSSASFAVDGCIAYNSQNFQGQSISAPRSTQTNTVVIPVGGSFDVPGDGVGVLVASVEVFRRAGCTATFRTPSDGQVGFIDINNRTTSGIFSNETESIFMDCVCDR